LLAIFPHPDDETFSAGGLIAAAVDRGVPVTVVSATRGEAGESAIPGLDDPQRLGAVREAELREAMGELGVADVRFLGYHDSGLAADPIEDARALLRADPKMVAAEIAAIVRDVRPFTVVTFGPDGIYGHPDHIRLHEITLEAIAIAADPALAPASSRPWQTPRLYFATTPREEMQALLERPNSPLAWLSPDAREHLGTPRAEITHVLDLAPWAGRKRAAIFAHRTQTAPGGPLSDITPNQMDRWLGREFFVRAPLPWHDPDGADDIIEELAAG
jgi:N-acetyl-1-D-myo-inositol-2-amino-2-deoxy-alpha-D-glucopyranoside deacetylase